MGNLLLVLAILFAALFIILPLVEKTAKPVEAESMQKFHRIFGILMLIMVIAVSVKFFLG